MADNIDIKDFTLGTAKTAKSKDIGGVQHPGKILYDEAGVEALGRVTAAPAANTLLARLKDLLTGIVLAPGSNAIGTVGVTALPATPAGTNMIGHVGGTEYETVAASQTNQALGATGAAGDYLAGVLIVPATTSPGAVAIKDGGGTAITIFAGGASSVSNLVPFYVPIGAKSGAGAWQVTTGANVSAIGFGDFT